MPDPKPGTHSARRTPNRAPILHARPQTGRPFCPSDSKPGAHPARQASKPDVYSARQTPNQAPILPARLKPDAPARPRTMGLFGQQGGCNAPETFVMVRIRGERQGIWAKKVEIFGNNWYRGGCKPCLPLWSEGRMRPTPLDAGGTHIHTRIHACRNLSGT